MERELNQNRGITDGYVIVPNYFLREWVKVLGVGPALLYLELLSYCHKEKDIVWPTLITLSNKLGISKNSLISYRKPLLKYGLIKKIVRRRAAQGNYHSNLYKVTPIEGAKIEPGLFQNLGEGSPKFTLDQVQNLNPNNNNIEHYQYNNNKEAVAVVDFIKLKEEERRKRIKEDLTGLDFKDSFREKLLKDFPLDKVEEKLELLKEKKHIINPAGWLMAALKNDYQGSKEEEIQEVIEEKKAEPPRKISSREEALRQIRLAKEKLALITPYYQIKENGEKGGLSVGIKRTNYSG
ncbi:MAG: helix-turn-helix domain-containing protein [Candidatus Atribacteria bacterium]|nr:helix-turn-helix domain-containing protein [Candidatus Atribacteria bacterium]